MTSVNIKKYLLLSDNKILLIDKDYNIRYYPENKYIGTIICASDIYEFNNKIIVIENHYGKAFLIENETIIPFCQNKYSFAELVENKAVVYWDDEKSISFFGILDIRTNELLLKKEDLMNRKLLSSNKLVCYDSTTIYLINYIENRSLFFFSISDFPSYKDGFGNERKADIKHVIGIYKNVLLIHVGGFRLVGIDIETGIMLYQINDVLKGEAKNNFLDAERGVLLTLSYDYFAEFDLDELVFMRKVKFNNSGVKVRASNFYKSDKDLYFCGYHDNARKPNAFGIFDTIKGEIAWFDTTKDNLGNFYGPPQANDKLLAILDDEGNLLVYDREETNG